MQARPKINAVSFDFDGCVFNRNYVDNQNKIHRLFNSNIGLLETVTNEIRNNNYVKAIFVVGSNRQDKFTDYTNDKRGNKGSCFPALVKIKEEIARRLADTEVECVLEDYLLADSYGKKNPGATFKACIADDKEFTHHEWFFDDQKLSLLYTQIHKLASENANADITYDFYDDRLDIHHDLSEFFTNYPQFIPRNVQVRFHFYNGAAINPLKTVPGAGIIDFHYHSSVFDMLQHACVPHTLDNEGRYKFDMDKALNQKDSNVLKFFKADLAARTDAFLNAIKRKDLNELYEKIEATTGFAARQCVAAAHQSTPEEASTLNLFHERLKNLQTELHADIAKQKAAGASDADIANSGAMKVVRETSQLLTNLSDATADEATLLQHIQTYEANCKLTSRWTTFWKAIAVVAITAAAIVIAGAIGMAIGIAAGAWSGPGAVATGLAGLFTGAATGAAIGLAIGAATTGMVAGAVTAGLLFRATPLEEKIELVVEQSRKVKQV